MVQTSKKIQGAILIIAKLISSFLAVLIMSVMCSAADKQPASSEEKGLPVAVQEKADIEYMLGYDNEMHGKWEEAMTNYSNALKNDPSSAYLKTQVGRMLVKLDRLPEAITMMEEILKKDPDYIPAMMYLAELYNSQKKVDDAIGMYQRVLKLQPEKTEALLSIGVLYASKQDFEKAQGLFKEVLKRDSDNLMALYYLGTVFVERKKYDAAEEQFKKLIELNPNFDAAYLNMGLISEIKGHGKEAEDYYKKALELNPQNIFVRERLAQVYISDKSYDKAVKELEEIAKNIPNVDIHLKLGMLYLQEREYDKAVSEFRIVTAAKPDDIPSRYYLALSLDELEHYDEAIDELKKILSLDPKNLNAFLNLAFIYTKKNQLTDAAKVYDEILTFDQGKPEIFSQLGNIYVQMKDYKKAGEVLSKGLQLFKDNDDLYFTIAVLYEKTDRFDDMVAALNNAIRINPKHADALNYLGYSYADKGIHLKEALSLIQRAYDLKPDNGYILDSLGWVYYKLGKYQEALKYLNNAIQSVNDDPVLFEHIGDVNEAMGNDKAALDAWEKSLKYHEKEEGVKERVEEKIKKLGSKRKSK